MTPLIVPMSPLRLAFQSPGANSAMFTDPVVRQPAIFSVRPRPLTLNGTGG